MAKRRFQNLKPEKHGGFWCVRPWLDVYVDNNRTRKRVRIKLGPLSIGVRQAQKLAAAESRKVNSSVVQVGAGVNFMHFIENDYRVKYLPLLKKPVQDCYLSHIKKYLEPVFGSGSIAEVTRGVLQSYFVNLKVEHATLVKLRDTLSSILRAAVDAEFLERNPMEGIKLPKDKRPKRAKPVLTPPQFYALLDLIPEPYATMVAVALWAGLRVSEVIALKWKDLKADAIVVCERYCRGDWDQPKSDASAAPIAVPPALIARIERLKTLQVSIRAGGAIRTYQAVKSSGPDDLVFQSVKDGKPMQDHNILNRFIKPAARQLGIDCNWLMLRRSFSTWNIHAGVDVKSAQGQMRHAQASTTLDVYAQIVPEGQRRAARLLSEYVQEEVKKEQGKSWSQLVQ